MHIDMNVASIRFRPRQGHDSAGSSRLPRTVRFGIEAALLIILISTASAQTDAGTITGTITDATSGESIAGVRVRILPDGTSAISNEAGTYVLRGLSPGSYTIEFASLGYLVDSADVRVKRDDENVRLDIRLTPDLTDYASVVVTARRTRGSEAAARETERSSPTVVSVLSAEAIAHSPDIATAEAIKRMPGVAITRMRGEAREAVIRGMEPRYNSTMIDGVRIPSPNTFSRVIQLDFLPADLLERVEVTKSLTPDMEADAIGGTVNLVMRSAPEKFILRAQLGTGYHTTFFDSDLSTFRTDSILRDPLERNGDGYRAVPGDFPRDNLLVEPSAAPPDLLGNITVGGRALNNRFGYLFAGSVQRKYQLSEVVRNYDAVDADNGLYLIDRQFRLHSHNKTKYGFNGKLDYILGANSHLEASGAVFLRRNRETRILSDTNLVFNPVLINGVRTVFQQHDIVSTKLAGDHRLGNFRIEWKGGVGYAKQYKPDRAEFLTSAALLGDSVISEPVFYACIRDWQHNEDRDYFGGADVTWLGWIDDNITLTGGALIRSKEKSNYQNAYRLLPIADSTNMIPRFTSIPETDWKVFNTGGTPEYGDNNYTAGEDVTGAYLMTSWKPGRWNVLTGVRVEGTSAEYATFDVNRLAHISAEKTYTDILPSLHIRYALTPKSNLRLSLSRSLSRPNFYDLVPYNVVGEEIREKGNPYLERTRSSNVDLKYEYFPETRRIFSIGAFFKHLEDPIEAVLDLSNPALPSMSPQNLGSATNVGAEIVAGTTIFETLSLLVNYTWTHSSITTDKIRFDKTTGTTLTVPETRGLQGQSQHTANVAVSWNDTAIGTFAQLDLSFTGSRIASVSPYYGLDHIQDDFPMLDFAAEQQLSRHFSLFLKLTNLLNADWTVRVGENDQVIESEHFGSDGKLGISYRL